MSNFMKIPSDPKQIVMFQTSLDEVVPKNSEVRLFSEAMDLLDWSPLEAKYSKVGCPAYPPRVMAKMLIFSYYKGIRSSRIMEETIRNDKRFIWLAGGLEPDHCTLSRFRKEHLEDIRTIFKGTVNLCIEARLVNLNLISVDGSKVRAVSSKKSLYNKERIEREMKAIDRILKEAEETDKREDALYRDKPDKPLPPELADPIQRQLRLKEIAERLKKENCTSVSSTEEDCRVMKTSHGRRPSYNVQVAVDSASHIITAMDVVNTVNDYGQLAPMLEQVIENTGCRPDMVLADTQYSDQASCQWLESNNQDALIPSMAPPPEKDNNLFSSQCFLESPDEDALVCPAGRKLSYWRKSRLSCALYKYYRCRSCEGCSFHAQCVTARKETRRVVRVRVDNEIRIQIHKRLNTPEGRSIYHKRQETVEPVFAHIKTHMKLDRFLLYEKSGALVESLLMGIAHNLKVWVSLSGCHIARFIAKMSFRTFLREFLVSPA